MGGEERGLIEYPVFWYKLNYVKLEVLKKIRVVEWISNTMLPKPRLGSIGLGCNKNIKDDAARAALEASIDY